MDKRTIKIKIFHTQKLIFCPWARNVNDRVKASLPVGQHNLTTVTSCSC
jgi:hypothetical protein